MGLEPPVSPDWHDHKPRQRVDTGAWRFGFARRRRMCPRMCSQTASQPRPAWRYESCFVNDLSREISYFARQKLPISVIDLKGRWSSGNCKDGQFVRGLCGRWPFTRFDGALLRGLIFFEKNA